MQSTVYIKSNGMKEIVETCFLHTERIPLVCKALKGPECTGEQACAPSLSCLQAESPPVQQGALHTGTFGTLLSSSLWT